MDRNKFTKNDYVVKPTTKNPAYKYNSKAVFVILTVFIILVTCVNF